MDEPKQGNSFSDIFTVMCIGMMLMTHDKEPISLMLTVEVLVILIMGLTFIHTMAALGTGAWKRELVHGVIHTLAGTGAFVLVQALLYQIAKLAA